MYDRDKPASQRCPAIAVLIVSGLICYEAACCLVVASLDQLLAPYCLLIPESIDHNQKLCLQQIFALHAL